MLQMPFQARMLDQFGGRMAMLDATFGTNKYGYPLTALLVSAAGTKYLPAGCPAPGCAHLFLLPATGAGPRRAGPRGARGLHDQQ